MLSIKIFNIGKWLVSFSLIFLVSCVQNEVEPMAQQATPESLSAYPSLDDPIGQIEYYEEWLSQENLTENDKARLENLLAEAREVATRMAGPTPSKAQMQQAIAEATMVALETPVPTVEPELGLMDSGLYFEVHVPRRVELTNIWQGYVEGNLLRIYAGRLLPDYRIATSVEEDTSQFGAVHIMIFYQDGKANEFLQSTEQEVGALRIVEVHDNYLMLNSTGTESQASKVYFLNLKTLKLGDSLSGLQIQVTPTTNSSP